MVPFADLFVDNIILNQINIIKDVLKFTDMDGT